MANGTEAEVQSTGGEAQPSPQQRARGEGHAPAPNPEQHLQEAHKLTIQMQGKPGGGLGDYAVWALVREERGKTKTLSVFKGTHQQAVAHFYHYIHPAKEVAPAAPPRRYGSAAPRSGSRPPQRSGGRPPQRSGGPGAPKK